MPWANSVKAFLLIALGGACGAVLRHGAQLLAAPAPWPWGTFSVNAIGCLIIGAVLGAWAGVAWFEGTWRAFLVVGVLGAFTTFSAFSVDTLELWRSGRLMATAAYVLGSVGLSIAAAFVGFRLGAVLR